MLVDGEPSTRRGGLRFLTRRTWRVLALVGSAGCLIGAGAASAASLRISLPKTVVWGHPVKIKASGFAAGRSTLEVWDLGKNSRCPAVTDNLVNGSVSFPNLLRIDMPDFVGPGHFHVHDLYGTGPPVGKHRICGYLVPNSGVPTFGPVAPDAIASTVIRSKRR